MVEVSAELAARLGFEMERRKRRCYSEREPGPASRMQRCFGLTIPGREYKTEPGCGRCWFTQPSG